MPQAVRLAFFQRSPLPVRLPGISQTEPRTLSHLHVWPIIQSSISGSITCAERSVLLSRLVLFLGVFRERVREAHLNPNPCGHIYGRNPKNVKSKSIIVTERIQTQAEIFQQTWFSSGGRAEIYAVVPEP